MTTQNEPIRKIIVVGQGLRVWLVASYLSARFPAPRYTIKVISEKNKSDMAEEIAGDDIVHTRPNIRRLHQLLQITERELQMEAKARPVFGVEAVKADGARVLLPYGGYGLDQAGAEFFQYWRRADIEGMALPLKRFNLAIRLHEEGKFINKAPAGFPPVDYGYQFSRPGYSGLLKRYAINNGVEYLGAFESVNTRQDNLLVSQVLAEGNIFDCDMVIDVTTTLNIAEGSNRSGQTGWVGNCLSIGRGPCIPEVLGIPEVPDILGVPDIPGVEVYMLQSAMDRFVALLPDMNFHACEINEYNRLADAELARIEDMADLLASNIKGKALQRKVDVFQARGRIVSEDYEVFSKAEWLAAFMDAGILPEYYDRLVDRADTTELQAWLKQFDSALCRFVENSSVSG